MTARTSILALAAAVALAPAALAQAPPAVDLSGAWDIQATGLLPGENVPCEFEGSAFITQQGSQLSGPVTLFLVSGPDGCPGEMMAQLSGTLDGLQISMGMLDGGQMFGVAYFTGTADQDGQQMEGGYNTESGPYAGTGGGWAAQAKQSVLEIPTLSTVGLLALVALLLTAATLLLLRRRPA